ncbi:hypothetical protein HG537_0D02340 [Torulaspora globosa]|uniref:Cell division control protein n=1 Tax=Torulaspora globosa TaxID=48254 RepID=A0A7H9HSG4_9SACH|nr:hypothetical protein HG537_0D02340 [Torulaspora sp. CBS 2947]
MDCSVGVATGRVLRSRKRSNEEFVIPSTPKKVKSENYAMPMTPPSTVVKKRCVKEPITPCASPMRLIFGKKSMYSRTKALLQRSSGLFTELEGHLPTRKSQYSDILSFLNRSLGERVSDSLYITGPPGTGKTAQIDAIVKNRFLPLVLPSTADSKVAGPATVKGLKNVSYYELPDGNVETVAVTTINCIAINDPSTIFNKIYTSLVSSPEPGAPVKTMSDLQRFMESYKSSTGFLVILDEMDKLVHSNLNDTNSTKTIFELFLLAKLPSARFTLIGIANSLDMKDRFLSRLNLRQDLLPETLVFHPYTPDEMFEIIMNRLKRVSGNEQDCVFNPMAIKFAAKKCSGNTGDLRKLFDVLRSSIEIVELQVVACKLKDKDANSSSPIKVGLPHVAKVFSQFMNTSSTRSRISKLNMQQRLILCAIVHREKTDIFQAHCSLDDTYDYYVNLLKNKDVLTPLKRNEFLETCNALETCGVTRIFQGRSTGKTKHAIKLIKSCIDEKEFEEEMSKVEILRNFLTK